MRNLFTLLCLLPLSLAAQISYTSSNYAAVGDTFLYSRSNAIAAAQVNFAQTGPAFAWNYGTLPIESQLSRAVRNPNNAGYQTSFITGCILGGTNPFACNSLWNTLTDLAIQQADDINLGVVQLSNVTSHYRKTSAAVDETVLGVSVEVAGAPLPLAFSYSRPDTLLRFPVSFGQADSSESLISADLTAVAGLAFKRGQKRRFVVEGWGSLVTPYQTYASTLKIKTLIERRDTLIQNGNQTVLPVVQEVEYSWWDAAWGQPVLRASGSVLAGIELITQVEFIDTLRCLAPQASFFPFPPVVLWNGSSAQAAFQNSSLNASLYSWNFGDGGTSTQVSPSHTYSAPGLYTVTLIACNPNCSPLQCDTASFPLVVVDTNAVVAVFSANPANVCLGDSVSFSNLSLNGSQYLWNFGDGTTSTLEEPVHLYADTGAYTVTLIVSGTGGSDTASNTVNVLAVPAPALGPDTTITTQQTLVLDAGAGGLIYFWSNLSFSQTLTLNGASLGVGTYTYSVSVTNNAFCTGSDTIVVTVTPPLSLAPAAEAFFRIETQPADESIRLIRAGAGLSPLRVKLFSLDGRQIWAGDWAGTGRLDIPAAHLPAGMYLVEAADGIRAARLKVVKR